MRALRRIGWAAALLVAATLIIKSFVGDVYRISSPSMEPTLSTGEWVWVRFDRSPPERGEIVVLEKGGELLVKRALGLGGETIRIVDGDVRIDGDVLAPSQGRGAPILLYDQTRTPLEQAFDHGSSNVDPWRVTEDGVWELDAREVERNSQAGLLRYRPEVVDGWPALHGAETRMAERRDVGDVVLAFSVLVLERGGRLRAVLVEKGDGFTLSVELTGDDVATIEFLRRDSGGLRVLATTSAPFPIGAWTSIVFANVDDHLTARIGEHVLEPVATGPNTLHATDHARLGLSLGNRAMLGGEGCRLRVRDVRLWRDLHYEAFGDFAVERELVLGSDQLFLLGDNSPASRDSRAWGPIEQADLIGRAAWVVWPLSAWRSLAQGRSAGAP